MPQTHKATQFLLDKTILQYMLDYRWLPQLIPQLGCIAS